MESTSKVYVVLEYGGEYEDKWEHIIGVCSSFELAEKLKAEAIAIRETKCNISYEELEKMLDYLYAQDDDFTYDTEEEGLQELFPDKDPDDIEAACRKYFSYDNFSGIDIEIVKFYN